jgi:two-component system invasion response regulator UvrY
LSEREFEVLVLLSQGQSVKNIAQSLTLSIKTVSTYRARLLDKLQLTNTAELIRYALDHHLVQ